MAIEHGAKHASGLHIPQLTCYPMETTNKRSACYRSPCVFNIASFHDRRMFGHSNESESKDSDPRLAHAPTQNACCKGLRHSSHARWLRVPPKCQQHVPPPSCDEARPQSPGILVFLPSGSRALPVPRLPTLYGDMLLNDNLPSKHVHLTAI